MSEDNTKIIKQLASSRGLIPHGITHSYTAGGFSWRGERMNIKIKLVAEYHEVWIDGELLFKHRDRRTALSVAKMATGLIKAKAPGWMV